MFSERPKRYLTRSQLAARYGVTMRSIMRWEADPKLNFPAGIQLNRIWAFAEVDIEEGERSRATSTRKAA